MLFVKIGGICQNFGSAKHKQVLCRGVGWGVGMQVVEEDDENIFKNLNFEIILLFLTFSLETFFFFIPISSCSHSSLLTNFS